MRKLKREIRKTLRTRGRGIDLFKDLLEVYREEYYEDNVYTIVYAILEDFLDTVFLTLSGIDKKAIVRGIEEEVYKFTKKLG